MTAEGFGRAGQRGRVGLQRLGRHKQRRPAMVGRQLQVEGVALEQRIGLAGGRLDPHKAPGRRRLLDAEIASAAHGDQARSALRGGVPLALQPLAHLPAVVGDEAQGRRLARHRDQGGLVPPLYGGAKEVVERRQTGPGRLAGGEIHDAELLIAAAHASHRHLPARGRERAGQIAITVVGKQPPRTPVRRLDDIEPADGAVGELGQVVAPDRLVGRGGLDHQPSTGWRQRHGTETLAGEKFIDRERMGLGRARQEAGAGQQARREAAHGKLLGLA